MKVKRNELDTLYLKFMHWRKSRTYAMWYAATRVAVVAMLVHLQIDLSYVEERYRCAADETSAFRDDHINEVQRLYRQNLDWFSNLGGRVTETERALEVLETLRKAHAEQYAVLDHYVDQLIADLEERRRKENPNQYPKWTGK